MKREEYVRLLQRPFDWMLKEDEQELAAAMGKEFGGREILEAWHEFQRLFPLDTFQRFEKWYREGRPLAAVRGPGQLSLTAMFEEHLERRRKKEHV